MDGRKKRRMHFCFGCGEEYSGRHMKRHKCVEKQRKEVFESSANIECSGSQMRTSPVCNNDSNSPTFWNEETEEVQDDVCLSESSESEEELCGEEFFSEEEDAVEDHPRDRTDMLIVSLLKMLLCWQSFFYVSDFAFSYLLLLIKSLLYLVAASSELTQELYKRFPSNIYQLHKSILFVKDRFQRHVVRPKCFTLYDFSDCKNIVEGVETSKKCSNVVFPNHALAHFRRPCGEVLLKPVSMQGKTNLVPRKSYSCKSIEESLEILVKREGFEDLCESWRYRNVPNDILMDVYDGDVWKCFNGEKYDFFTVERNFGVMLNVDWFQPFKHTNYSVGAIYLTILNLPRTERFKKKNIILIGLIPDMKTEPPTNTFIEPLVDELKEAWQGFSMKSFKSPSQPVTFKLALICVGCDIPASRKLCGFLGHAATKGCNKCMKSFDGGVGEKNYGGFDTCCELRDLEKHKEIVGKIVRSKTKTSREQLEKEYGVRYSVLLELDYFDPVKMTIIDPMHNLFLGTAKRMLSIWKDHKLLQSEHFEIIQDRIEGIFCPSDVGKLPQKMASSLGSFNADQYKNWTILFSIYALKGVLPDDHLEYWRKFVLACKILCTRTLSRSNVRVANLLLISFCKKIEQAFGSECVTPNMHLHIHLDKCLYDFGPVYSFWLFSFERENGILGSVPTNKRDIEKQLMRKFLKNSYSVDLFSDEVVEEQFGPDFQKLKVLYEDNQRGTLSLIHKNSNYDLVQMSSKNVRIESLSWIFDSFDGVKISTLKNCTLNERNVVFLKSMYKNLYFNVEESRISVCNTCRSTKYIDIYGSVLGIKMGRSSRSSMIMAHWHGDGGQIIKYEDMELCPRPGQIENIILHNVLIDDKSCVHILAQVRWFAKPNENVLKYYGKPVEAWLRDVYDVEGPSTYIPVQRIKSKFVYAYDRVGGNNVIVVMPRERFLC